MKQITVSAPGKLMLFGEHAVVYGRPCIVTAVGQRMKVTVELLSEPTFQLNAPDVSISEYQKPISDLGKAGIPKGAKFVEFALYNFYKIYNHYKNYSGVRISTKSEFNSQFGFGSSSASAVCVIKALSVILGKKLSNKQLFDLSYKTVLDVQGKGSGFDVAAAIFGGTIYFVKGGKVIEPLKIDNLPLIVGYSGVKADTVTLINKVLEKAKKYPEVIEDIYTNIGKLVEQAKRAILSKDFQTLGELMDINEGCLSALGVEGTKLSEMIYAARETGAYGAKLSGAGMGDCMIALAPPSKERMVKNAITKAGGQIIDVKTNTEGVRIET